MEVDFDMKCLLKLRETISLGCDNYEELFKKTNITMDLLLENDCSISINFLIRTGLDINEQSLEKSLLYRAVEFKASKCVELLLSLGRIPLRSVASCRP